MKTSLNRKGKSRKLEAFIEAKEILAGALEARRSHTLTKRVRFPSPHPAKG